MAWPGIKVQACNGIAETSALILGLSPASHAAISSGAVGGDIFASNILSSSVMVVLARTAALRNSDPNAVAFAQVRHLNVSGPIVSSPGVIAGRGRYMATDVPRTATGMRSCLRRGLRDTCARRVKTMNAAERMASRRRFLCPDFQLTCTHRGPETRRRRARSPELGTTQRAVSEILRIGPAKLTAAESYLLAVGNAHRVMFNSNARTCRNEPRFSH